MATEPNEPLKPIYFRAPESIVDEVREAAREDMRSLALEFGYLLRLGLQRRAEERGDGRRKSAAGRSSAPRGE